jgi:hypothetical protein
MKLLVIQCGSASIYTINRVTWERSMQQQSWYELLSKQFKGYPAWAIELGIYGFIFLILGFLCKSFGKLFVLAVLLCAAALAVVYYFDLAPELLVQVKDFVGLHDMQILGDIPPIFMAWARGHAFACIGAVIGFVLGYSLG